MQEPNLEQRRCLYEMYEVLHRSYFAPMKKRSVLTAALAYEPWSWRVVGISVDALIAIKANGFRKPPNVLSRDHAVPRAKTYAELFEGELKPFDEWWSRIWDNDQTVIVTNAEHSSRSFSNTIAVDPSLGLFTNGSLVGWRHRIGHEGQFVRKLCEELGL